MSGPSRPDPRLVVALLLLAAYAVPLFVPPAAQPLSVPAPDATLLQRLFPGVPGWWVAARLVCLLTAAVLVALAARRPPTSALHRSRRSFATAVAQVPRGALLAALAIAAVHAVLSLAARHFGGLMQLFYVALLVVPAGVVWRAERSVVPRPARVMDQRSIIAVGAVLALWLVARLPAAWHSPRATDAVDTWQNYVWFARGVSEGRNLLTQSSELGVSDAYMLLLGAPILSATGMPPSFAWLQGVHALWLVGTGLVIAWLAAAIAGRAVAPLAAAVALFSPFVLWLPYCGAPFGIQTCLAALVLWLLFRIYTHASIAALAALGGLTGLAATIPQLMPLGLAVCATVVVLLWRRPRAPLIVWAIPALSFAAALSPGLPDVDTIRAFPGRYVGLHAQWSGLEALLLGQRPIGDVMAVWELWQNGHPGRLDIPLSGLLAPFAVARTPLRLWGDALFEPIGLGLAACGLAVCLRYARAARSARILLAVSLLAILPGVLTSTYDRASPTRNIILVVVVAVLAGVGFTSLRRGLIPRTRMRVAAAALTAVVIVSGCVLFDVITPRILATSWLEIAMRAVRERPPAGGAILLQHGSLKVDWQDARVDDAARAFRNLQPAVDAARENAQTAAVTRTRFEWLHVQQMASQLPQPPLPVRSFEDPGNLIKTGSNRESAAEVYLWSPGLEGDYAVTRAVCGLWPGAALYSLTDSAGLSRALAARPAGPGWTPALPASRWSVSTCDAQPQL